MTILDGKALAEKIKKQLGERVTSLKNSGAPVPHLAAILVGDDPASHAYVSSKIKSCEAIGFKSTLIRFDNDVSEQELLNAIISINGNEDIDGLIVQLPLPPHISVNKVIEMTDFRKDVDGFHPINIGRMSKGITALLPATPKGILSLIQEYEIPTAGKSCVIVGRSQIVGAPMSMLMSRDDYPGNCTVTLCHRHTQNLGAYTRQADILIAAVGKPGIITADMVKAGATVIDVGITRVEDASRKSGFKLAGDVDYDSVAPKCEYITPVPGGVGPLTIASLLTNTLQAYEQRRGKDGKLI